MTKVIDSVRMLCIGCVAVLATVFGDFWFLFAAFLALNVVDYITGSMKARFTKTEKSDKGAAGIIKKVGYWVAISISFFVGVSFEQMGKTIGINLKFVELAGWFTLATFIVNECRSILENLIVLGVPVPGFLIKGLEVAANAVNNVTDKDGGKK